MSTKAIEELLQNEDFNKRIDAVKQFRNVSNEQERKQLFLKVIEDFNHEVRAAAANEIELCPSIYAKFLSDPDPQVRIAIIEHSIEIRKTQSDILTNLQNVVNDSVPNVRCAFAKVLHKHAEFTNSKGEIDKTVLASTIIQNIDRLLSDRNDDVRIAASQNIKFLTIQFGFDFVFEQLHNSLHHMLTDTQWRVRINAVELLFGLSLVCPVEFFNDNLFPFFRQFLRDPCSKIRQFTLSALPNLASHFDEEWLKTTLIEELQTLAQSDNFLHRETYLYSISVLAGFFPVQYQSNYVFQPMIRMLKDQVQNVVLLAIELLSKHKDSIHPFRRQYELKPILEELAENSPPTTKARAAKLIENLQ